MAKQPESNPEDHSETRQAKGKESDRRARVRRALLRQARIYPVLDLVDLAVSDISVRGLHGATTAQLALRERVHVSFDSFHFLTAGVRWTSGGSYGLETVSPLLFGQGGDPIESAAEGQQDRPARMIVDLQAVLARSRPAEAVRVRNISEGGAMIEMATPPAIGEAVLLEIGHAPALWAQVQWQDEIFLGLRFLKEIDVGQYLSTTR
jgi:hypothetical protein